MKGILDGWTEENLLAVLEGGAKMRGQDPALMKPFLETMKKVWGTGVDFSSKMAFTEIFCKFCGDNVSYENMLGIENYENASESYSKFRPFLEPWSVWKKFVMTNQHTITCLTFVQKLFAMV